MQDRIAPLVVYGHPFSSYTQKLLIALHENATPYALRTIGPDAPQVVADWLARWPLALFPVLVDGGTTVVESSIIIEHLQIHHPGPVRLLPEDAAAALPVRFLDRFFDLHVMDPVQQAVRGAMSGDAGKRADALAAAVPRLDRAYAWLDAELAGRTWAAGEAFTLADCAAAPALFYADWTHPIAPRHAVLRAYRARLLARPSFARAVDAARPLRHLFPFGAPDRD